MLNALNRQRCVCLGLVALLAVFGATTIVGAAPPVFSQVTVFGDSLCDTGNLLIATRGGFPFGPPGSDALFPIPPYDDQGRITNDLDPAVTNDGSIWVDVLGPELGVAPPAPYPLPFGGTCYAFGGAETGSGISDRLTPNIGEQIGAFRDAGGGFVGNELIVVWGGSNDFSPIPPNPLPRPKDVVNNLANHISDLAALNGKYFLVPNLAPLGETPEARANGRLAQLTLNLLSLYTNILLDKQLDELEQELGITIFRFDVFGLLVAVLDDPDAFGLTNTTEPAFTLESYEVVANPDEYLWWDTVHPTRAAHGLLGKVASVVVTVGGLQEALDPHAEPPIRICGFFAELTRLGLLLRLEGVQRGLAHGDFQASFDRLSDFRQRIVHLVSRRRISEADAAPLLDQCDAALAMLAELVL